MFPNKETVNWDKVPITKPIIAFLKHLFFLYMRVAGKINAIENNKSENSPTVKVDVKGNFIIVLIAKTATADKGP